MAELPEHIKEGDKVNISFSNGDHYLNATILYRPYQVATDCWRIRTHDNNLVYVQHFETMLLLKEAQNGTLGS